MFKFIKLFIFLFIFSNACLIQNIFGLNLNDQDIESLEGELSLLREDYNSFNFSLDDFRGEIANLGQDINLNSNSSTLKQFFKAFRKNKILDLKLGSVAGFPVKIAMYGDDFLKTSFLGFHLLNDKKFYNQFVDLYNQLVLDKILENSKNYINFFSTIHSQWDIHKYILKNQKISFKSFVNSNQSLHFLYFIFAEIIRIGQDIALEERTVSFGAVLNRDPVFVNNPVYRVIFGLPINISTFLELYFSVSQDITKSYLYFLNMVIQGLILYYSSNEFSNKYCSAFLKKYYKVLNSYIFVFLKETYIYKRILTLLDSDFYIPKWSKYLATNWKDVVEILEKYEDLKSKHPKRTKANDDLFLELENKLKAHISVAHEADFITWVRNKNIIYNNEKIITNWLVHIPTYAFIVFNVFKYIKDNHFKGQAI